MEMFEVSAFETMSLNQLLCLANEASLQALHMGLRMGQHLSLGVATLSELVAELRRLQVPNRQMMVGGLELLAAVSQTLVEA